MIDFLPAAAAIDEGWWLWRFLGRLHPLVVHFPIALLVSAALLDGWRLIRKRAAPSVLVIFCLFVAALGAIGSAVLGWISAAAERPDAETARLLSLHRWLGLALAAATPVVALAAIRAKTTHSRPVLHAYRAGLWSCLALMSMAAHYGGMLVYGEGYLSSSFASALPADPTPTAAAATTELSFERDIEPIFRSHCIKCHGPEKQKGKLRLDTREWALKGGISGKVLVPGSAPESTLYSLLLEKEAEDRMPPKSNPLSAEKVAMIRDWIDQGAFWPEGRRIASPAGGGP